MMKCVMTKSWFTHGSGVVVSSVVVWVGTSHLFSLILASGMYLLRLACVRCFQAKLVKSNVAKVYTGSCKLISGVQVNRLFDTNDRRGSLGSGTEAD